MLRERRTITMLNTSANRPRIVIATTLLGILLAIMTVPAHANDVGLEDGATFDDGICWEADGTQGISTLDGQCVTAADYDELFSYEVLASTATHTSSTASVATTYGIAAQSGNASERDRRFQGSFEPTFVEYVALLHGRPLL